MGADRNPYSNSFGGGALGFGGLNVGEATQTGWGQVIFTQDTAPLNMPPPPHTWALNNNDPQELRRPMNGKNPNSRNHRQEGQNVSYFDGHAGWKKDPRCGADDDWIWGTLTPDPSGQNKLYPAVMTGYTGVTYGMMRSDAEWLTDSILIP
jgi:hypothetical protein